MARTVLTSIESERRVFNYTSLRKKGVGQVRRLSGYLSGFGQAIAFAKLCGGGRRIFDRR